MGAFRILLVLLFLGILGYTAIVVAEHGFNLLQVFFGDIVEMGWPGQFNVDFTSFLTLSAYLFIVSFGAKGDVNKLLLGKVRANS